MPIVFNLDVMLASRKMNLTHLSEDTGVKLATLSEIKNGKIKEVRLDTMEKICCALECDFSDIFQVVTEEQYRMLYGL